MKERESMSVGMREKEGEGGEKERKEGIKIDRVCMCV